MTVHPVNQKKSGFQTLNGHSKRLEVCMACLFVYKPLHISFVKPTGSVCSSVAVQTSQTWKSSALLLARSALFPAKAITIFGLACLWSSFTQFFARANDSWMKNKTCISVKHFLDSELSRLCLKGTYHAFFSYFSHRSKNDFSKPFFTLSLNCSIK